MRSILTTALSTAMLFLMLGASLAGPDAYRALGFEPKDVLTSTVLTTKVVPGEAKQIVCIATYFTGEKDEKRAVNVRLGIFRQSGERLVPLYTRDFGEELGGGVGNGDLQVLDLDRDGVNEIVLSLDSYADPLIDQRLAEVLLHDGSEFRVGWSGPIEYDATKAVRNVPAERRDRYVREIDIVDTMRTRGITLFFDKKVVAIAGQRLPEPKIVEETFPLRPDAAR